MHVVKSINRIKRTQSETNMSLQVTSTEATTVNRFLFVFPRNCTAFTKKTDNAPSRKNENVFGVLFFTESK